jgi:Pyruvate/2-oxoacid:ferredoxin oxidoreductase delta subunit
MNMKETSYEKLAEHLDQLPGGFAPSDTGAEIRLLQRLFSTEEAELATHLTLDREKAQVIAQRAKLPLAETEQRLNEMSNKGLIFSIQQEDSPTLYQAVPFVIGIYEFQVNNLSKDLLRDLAYYWRDRKKRSQMETIPQIRTIPIGESIKPHLEVLSYEQVNELVKSEDQFAVAPCICRRIARKTGGGCDAPEESCLVFGDWADYYVRDGRGRSIDRSEVLKILARADAANLVLQPSNSINPSFICCCCGCCCGILGGLKDHPRPSEIVASSFIAKYEPEICTGCWTCLERCQMQALTEEVDRVTLDTNRCIGCGLCVSTCPSGALSLVRKPDSECTQIPDTMDATWRVIRQAQTEIP